jgi:predicted ATP-dependent serine protease
MASGATAVNKDFLDSAIAVLGRTYNNPEESKVEQAVDLLRKSITCKKESNVIRADHVIEESGIFIPYGVPWIDTWLRGGLRLQELMLIGATPHGGKTHLLVWCGIQFILEGHKVLYVVGEDLLSDVKSYFAKGIANREALQNLWFADVQDVTFGVPQVEEAYEKLKDEGIQILIIDHVDLMRGAPGKADWEAISDVMVGLKMLAKRLNIIIITASQLNYQQEGVRGNARFYRAKVGKSANADVIILVDDVLPSGEYLVSLTKARGRRRVSNDQRQKSLMVDWEAMVIEDLGG